MRPISVLALVAALPVLALPNQVLAAVAVGAVDAPSEIYGTLGRGAFAGLRARF